MTGKEFAFPQGTFGGLTERDWFASFAIAGLLADASNITMDGKKTPLNMADAAYQIADAMLAERSRKP